MKTLSVDGLDHLVLVVRDVHATGAFYRRVLGMEVETFGRGRTALRFGRQKINLEPTGELTADRAAPGPGHLCFVTSAPLAEWIARRENPLTARVLVNRIWKHHFGQGIVRSLDNFGKTGEEPTHPELLDFLANRFVEAGWSVKALHRMLVLSSAYAMSSSPSEAALRIDPQNRLLQRMPVQRLEGETVRDSILAIAGTLDRHLYGPSITPHISKYQDGRGKPESGPLDGNSRRSVYIQVRRNFITPMFLAFDYPLPISTIGSRSTSTVPAQALMMLNNELVAFQAQQWARRIVAEEAMLVQALGESYATYRERSWRLLTFVF